MKRNLSSIGIVLFFFVILICPKSVFIGASNGLLLWYQIILPTLFPFLLISNLMLNTGGMRIISDLFGRIISGIFHVSPNAAFVVVTGFLCGYPMGAKTAADLTEAGYISKDEGEYLLSFCNNCSPGFIFNYIVWKSLGRQELLIPTLLNLMLAPVIVSFFARKTFVFENKKDMKTEKKDFHFRDIDFSIIESFNILVKVGGYIMLFSIIIVLLEQLANENMFVMCILASLEITNGIQIINELNLCFELQYILTLALSAFGGWCSIAQTQCVVQKAGFRISSYIIEKLAAALTASLLGLIYLRICYR